MNHNKLQELLGSRPKLHKWASREWNDGGLEDRFLRSFLDRIEVLFKQKGPLHFIETGAGLSTLLFLACGPARLVTIAPDTELKNRILETADRFGIETKSLEYFTATSQDALPEVTRSEQFDVGLIDGHHSYPLAFLDFFYINRTLATDSLLAIDDLHLGSGRELFQFVRAQLEFDLDVLMWKTAIFRKTKDVRTVPEMCPYNKIMSYTRPIDRA